MKTFLDTRPAIRRALLWAVPCVLLLAVVGVELYRGKTAQDVVPAEPARPPAPVSVALLPPYDVTGGADSLTAIGERTLFNATRRPAPPAPPSDGGPKHLQRGEYVLTGTTVFGDKAVAYLKGKDGKQRTVRMGDTLDGMRVANVGPGSVKFAVGDDSEELTLKVAAGPKMTIQPAAESGAAVQPGLPPAGGGNPAALTQPGPGAVNVPAPVPQSTADRRRAARAAQQAAAAAAASGSAGAAAATPGATPPYAGGGRRNGQATP